MNNDYIFLPGILLLIIYNLKFFQQNGYFIKRDFFNFYKKNIFNLIIIGLIVILYKVYDNNLIMALISLVFVLFLFIRIISQRIIKLKITRRMKCLIVTVTILMGISFYFINIYTFFILNFLIYLANIINWPLEKLIYRKYIFKLKKTLDDFKGIKIAITGSYGKTSTKNFLAKILEKKYNVFYTEKSFNTPMGIAKSVIGNLNQFYDICILEFGACKKNDIKELMELTKIDIAILTGISNQHLETFKTQDNIVREKFKIIEMLPRESIGIVNNLSFYVKNYFIKNDCKVIYFENERNELIYTRDIKEIEDYLNFELFYKKQKYDISLNVLGKYNVYNFMLCVHCALLLKMDIKDIIDQTSKIRAVNNRVQLTKKNSSVLINNSFNSNLEGALTNLDILKNFEGKRVVITPGLVDLGKEQKASNLEFIKKINEISDYCIVINRRNRNFFIENLTIPYKTFDYFKDGYNYFLKNFSGKVVCLIENDLPDKY